MVVGQVPEPVDLVVVGAGPGGYAAALRAAQLGRQVLLVDSGGEAGLGGVCLHVGCIPSKALIELADLAHRARGASRAGLTLSGSEIDFARFQTWKKGIVNGLVGGVRGLLKAGRVAVARGAFRFTAPGKGVITPDDDQVRFVDFTDLILATGSRPTALPVLPVDGEHILDSTGALALDALPQTLAIVGAGYIGIEIGIAFAKLGSAVTIVEAESRILPGMDAELAVPVARTLAALGVDVRLNARASGAEDGALIVEGGEDSGTARVAAEKIVVAVGRRPNTDDLELAAAGLATDRNGLLQVADDRRVHPHIAAIGDITPGPALAHKASAEAQVAAEALCGKPVGFDATVVPEVVFSDPEIASAGLTLAAAKEAGHDARGDVFPLAASGRARTLSAREGFLQIVSDGDQCVLGVHIAAPHASDLIGEGVLAIEMGATVEDLALSIHAHPSLGELYGEAAHLALGRPVHLPLRARR